MLQQILRSRHVRRGPASPENLRESVLLQPPARPGGRLAVGLAVMFKHRAGSALIYSFVFLALSSSVADAAGPRPSWRKLDRELLRRAGAAVSSQTTSTIVTLNAGVQLPALYRTYARQSLGASNAYVLDLPNSLLGTLADDASVARISHNRFVYAHNFRTSVTSGTLFVRQLLGFTGAGVGVAVLDSGIATFHDDFTDPRKTFSSHPYGDQRVAYFKDFVKGAPLPYDDNGHGTHVSGVIAGNGFDSRGEKSGMAPDAAIVSLKVLDANGQGKVSDVIAALNWVGSNAAVYHIRIVNLSVGAAVLESYDTDPLTLAAKALVDKGIVVVCAAGNFGTDSGGHKLWGAITAPGNAPWVITVGASSSKGTLMRKDDLVANFSSRGPTAINFAAKPDIVASGVGTVSTVAPGSTLYSRFAQFRVAGAFSTPNSPYMALSGTSQAAPVVSGTIALMLQANPNLTPNLVKAILQYTAQVRPGYKPLEQGAGFLNGFGAVRLAQFYATARRGTRVPTESIWSRRINWGNHRIRGGFLLPDANAWKLGVTWGSAKTLGSDGDNIVWGTASDGDNIVWGTTRDGDNIVWGTLRDGDNIVWGTMANDGDNIVWGTARNGHNIVWGTASDGDNIVWGTSGDGDNIVWGTMADGDNIVWGTDCKGADCGNVVWGAMAGDGDNIVWGTASDGDNIVWGTSADGDNIVWGTASDGDNIVWGTAVDGDNIVWGTMADGDNIVWGTSANDGDNIVWGTERDGDNIVWGTTRQADLLISSRPFGWFQNPVHSLRWLSQEFGDDLVVGRRPR
jgi:serine protease AprX